MKIMSAGFDGEESDSINYAAPRKKSKGNATNDTEQWRRISSGADAGQCLALVPYQPPLFPVSGSAPAGQDRPKPVARRDCPPGFRIRGRKLPPNPLKEIPGQRIGSHSRGQETLERLKGKIILEGQKEKGKGISKRHKGDQDVPILSRSEEEAGAKNSSRASSSRPSKNPSRLVLKLNLRKSEKKEVTRKPEGLKRFYTFNQKAPELEPHNHPRTRVKYVLRSFDDMRRQYMIDDQQEPKESGMKRPDLKAYAAFNDYRVNGLERIVGNVPGVEVGDHYYFRMELLLISLHRQSQGGIDYIPEPRSPYRDSEGRKLAIAVSVIASGGYEDDKDEGNVLIYTGSGGNNSKNNSKPAIDQQLSRGNLGLKNCCAVGSPVRVIRGYEYKKSPKYPAPSCKVYVYDGLYNVVSADLVPGTHGLKVWQFKLVRRAGQGPQTSLVLFKGKSMPNILDSLGELVLDEDVAGGQEPFKIRVVGRVEENVTLHRFKYIAKLYFAPGLTKPTAGPACDCRGPCISSERCGCTDRGDGTDNYNEEGCLLIAKRLLYECGPLCHCVRTGHCTNRVSQKGLRYEMEVFQTKHKGWGVRSPNFITQGSFICEYVGQIIRDRDAEAQVARDDYMFDLTIPNDMESRFGLADIGRRKASKLDDEEENDDTDKFTIDARQYGNLARFINHSCDPNLFVQCVFYDHHDQRFPHIMLFASEHISPYVELTYDYGYIIDKVTVNGKIKVKRCYCGGKSCSGRLY